MSETSACDCAGSAQGAPNNRGMAWRRCNAFSLPAGGAAAKRRREFKYLAFAEQVQFVKANFARGLFLTAMPQLQVHEPERAE